MTRSTRYRDMFRLQLGPAHHVNSLGEIRQVHDRLSRRVAGPYHDDFLTLAEVCFHLGGGVVDAGAFEVLDRATSSFRYSTPLRPARSGCEAECRPAA